MHRTPNHTPRSPPILQLLMNPFAIEEEKDYEKNKLKGLLYIL